MTSRRVVEVSGVSWRPHGRREPTLRELTLTLRPGERVLLAGASGSGKSTLLRLLAGLGDESLGELTGELRTPGGDRPGGAGLLLQDPTHTVVAEHAGRDVAFGPENRQAERPEIAARTERALAAVGFPYSAARRSTDLSGGELQRLALAGALALDPDLLLLDEPTAMLDPEGAATVRDAVISGVGGRAITVVIVDHQPADWLDFCDRMLVLAPDGRLLADGPARTVLAERRSELLAAGVWVPGEPAPEPVQVGRPTASGLSRPAPDHPAAAPAPPTATPDLPVATPELAEVASEDAVEAPDHAAATAKRPVANPEHPEETSEDAAVTPERAAATAEHQAATSERAAATAEHAVETPEHPPEPAEYPMAAAEHAAATANHQAATRDHLAATPEHRTAISERAAVIAEHPVDTPERPPAISEHAAATADHQAATCEHRAATPDRAAVTSEYPAATSERPAAAAESAAATSEPQAPTAARPSAPPEPPTEQALIYRANGLGFGPPVRGSVGEAARLVEGLDLDLRRGELVAVQGRSGSGKSTLLRVLSGLLPVTEGQILVESDLFDAKSAISRRQGDTGGRDQAISLGRLARRSRELARIVAWQPQHAEQQLTRRTVETEVLATSEALFADDPTRLAAARRRAEELLVALGLDRLRGADPYQLSGGEQRRVALAAAVAHRPAVVLLDEPTVGQDRQTWAAVAGVIETLRADGTAVVVATHDQDLATRADRRIELGASMEAPAERPDYRIVPVIEPGDPPTARCNPAALLLVALAAAIGSFFVDHWLVGVLTLVLVALLSPLAVRGVRSTLARLVPVTLAALTVGWSALAFSDRGFLAAQSWPVAAAEITRIGCLVIPGVLLIPSLPPSRLGDALAQRLRLPHRPVVAVSAGLLRLQQMLDVWRTMADVRRIRGLDPGRSPVGRVRQAAGLTFALLVYALRSAQELALSMDARGFAGARRRTFALPSPWGGADWTAVGAATLLVATPIVLGQLLG